MTPEGPSLHCWQKLLPADGMSAARWGLEGASARPRWAARRQDYTTSMSVCKGMPLPLLAQAV